MKKKLHQILYYEKVKGGDISGFLEEFGQKHGFDQCSSKKEGMVWLEQMTGDLASKREIKRLNRPAAGRCEMGHGGIGHYFSHIYVEEGVADHEETLRILEHFPNAKVIPIHHYKDVFNRKHQSFYEQKGHPALILAQKEGRLVYPGAPLCQSFGNHYFYYTSCMMNCLYDCEYCYLQGMYPSGNVVLFVNLEDIFREVDELLEKHPVYLCVSYDTDLMAFEGIAGFVGRWHEFVKTRPQLVIEIRTKSGAFDRIKHLKPLPNMIFAWTLSPERIVEKYEHHTASLKLRIRHLHEAADAGFPVRVCFDPLIYEEDFEALYKELVDQVFARPFDLLDASIGVFRVSAEYLKQMRRQRPDSPLLWFPFAVENGAYHYGHELSEKMTETVKVFLRRMWMDQKYLCGMEGMGMSDMIRDSQRCCPGNGVSENGSSGSANRAALENGSRAVIVTGASSGLGRAIAKSLAGEGFQVFGVGRNFGEDAWPEIFIRSLWI